MKMTIRITTTITCISVLTCLLSLSASLPAQTFDRDPLSGNDPSKFNPRLSLALNADATAGGGGGAEANEAESQEALAKAAQNPVANLISVPIQNNWDFGIGMADAMKYTANIQPHPHESTNR